MARRLKVAKRIHSGREIKGKTNNNRNLWIAKRRSIRRHTYRWRGGCSLRDGLSSFYDGLKMPIWRCRRRWRQNGGKRNRQWWKDIWKKKIHMKREVHKTVVRWRQTIKTHLREELRVMRKSSMSKASMRRRDINLCGRSISVDCSFSLSISLSREKNKQSHAK